MFQKLKNYLYHLPRSIFYSVRYRFPGKKLFLIGVTGTDGKTSTCILIHHILTNNGIKVGLISTLGAKIDQDYITTGLHTTSPDPATIQKLLSKMQNSGLTHAVVEVTSHALDQFRFWGCNFKIGVFTNLSHEHLDYHKTMDNYLIAKSKLLNQAEVAIANLDDNYFNKLKEVVSKKIVTYSLKNKADYFAQNIKAENGFSTFTLNQNNFTTNTSYRYHLYNILAAIAAASKVGIPIKNILDSLKVLPETKGRREIVSCKKDITCIVDFAHTPNALKQTLESLKDSTKNNLITIYGATGGRDATKRPEMGKIVSSLSHLSIITSDDTRNEKIEDITKQIESGIDSKKCKFIDKIPTTLREVKNIYKLLKTANVYFTVPNRQDAFNLAALLAQKGDTVVACGKGHETTILLGKTEYPWSETLAFKTAFK